MLKHTQMNAQAQTHNLVFKLSVKKLKCSNTHHMMHKHKTQFAFQTVKKTKMGSCALEHLVARVFEHLTTQHNRSRNEMAFRFFYIE